jgi:pyruvate dehydrogenase E2 component (dihydrolipoamide acetyltransferase)
MNDGMVVKWLKKEGDAVKKGDHLVEIESSKVNGDVEAPADGILGRILIFEGTVVPVSARLAVLLSPGDDPSSLPPAPARVASAASAGGSANAGAPRTPAPAASGAAPASGAPSGPKQVTPIARKIAKDMGVDVERVAGTGPGGRVTEEDVRKAASQGVPASAVSAASPAAPSAIPVKEIIRVAGMRATIARRMTESAQAPQVTLNTHADVTAATELMEKLVSDWRQHRLRPQYQDLVLAAVTRALKDHPRANAHLAGNEVRVFDKINLGVAMAVPDGLLVPVIHDAGTKTLLQLAQAVRDLAQRSKANSLGIADLTGGTFTITNLGAYDVESFNPLLDPPQVGILGVGRVEQRPSVVDGEIKVRSIGHLSLTFDHRAWDGAPAGDFLKSVARYLKEPLWMAP